MDCKAKLRRLAFVFAGIVAFLLFLHCVLKFIPSPALNAFMQRENSTRFYDRNGVLLQVRPLENGLRREYYTLDELPENLVQAFIDAEDKNFYYHCGVDFISIFRALVQNKKAGRIVSGASTITMQLVRIIYPRKTAVSAKTKVLEMLRAVFIEAKLSKKQILELYLNSVPFGFQTEGVG
ncbi:MAG: transglycosylase domain-containing protein, partial [Treponema sp.]|nr:transglycosylase domain-containing protein [Treponema sp.]